MMMTWAGYTALSQVPKPLIGKTFYNMNLWNMDPRFGGTPSVKFTSANTASVKKGDVMENAKVKLYKKGFIITTEHRKIADTFQFEIMPAKTANADGYEMKDQQGAIWTTRFSASPDDAALKAYPEAKSGYVKNVIVLPKKNNEELYKVELYAGVIQEADCNNHTMLGVIEEQQIDGYGYTYYNVKTEERIISTRKGCPDQKKAIQFISTLPLIIRYNSNAPIVIYSPKDVQIRYKIYTTNNQWEVARPR